MKMEMEIFSLIRTNEAEISAAIAKDWNWKIIKQAFTDVELVVFFKTTLERHHQALQHERMLHELS